MPQDSANNQTLMHPLLRAAVDQQLLGATQARQLENNPPRNLITTLITQERINATKLAKACATYHNIPYLSLHDISHEQLATTHISDDLLLTHCILPLNFNDNIITFAIADPQALIALNDITFKYNLKHTQVICNYTELLRLINQVTSQKHYTASMTQEATHANTELVHTILNDAYISKASDIHLQALPHQLRICMRIDGLLVKRADLPQCKIQPITTCIKVMAQLDIAQSRLPQDGRFQFTTSQGYPCDCRVSTLPSMHGEKLVIRLLDQQQQLLSLDELGLNPSTSQAVTAALAKSQGLIIMTGPTGSGKTKTLYSMLQHINHISRNILTAEDPIEIELPGITQSSTNTTLDLDFAKLLRCFLRQDPDVIMVGEIRDEETAAMATRAAQTGHLVLSSLHTNSAAESITRLMNLGIAPYNLANSLSLLMAQRLVRRLCPHCKEPKKISLKTLPNRYQQAWHNDTIIDHTAVGCIHCINGYRQRTGLFEMINITPDIQQAILSNQTNLVTQDKSTSLLHDALTKVADSTTNLAEITRVI